MSPFFANISELLKSLRDMTHKDTLFELTHQERFDNSMICQQTILSYFNPSLPTTIQVDPPTLT